MHKIDKANAEALRRMLVGDPVLVDVIPAGEALKGLTARHILHAGPPIGWERMCGPMRGAIMGIAVFEGWASDRGYVAGDVVVIDLVGHSSTTW